MAYQGEPINEVRIGERLVGYGHPSYVIAEIGINHNGDIDLARRLISVAVAAGCDAVKFQKRTVDVVYTADELGRPRESPFGSTNGDLKRGLEFGPDEYQLVARYCREVKMPWFASCWDEESVDFIEKFNPPCYKIASASLTDDNLLQHTRATGKPVILSTGMSTVEEIDHAVEVLGRENLILLHACSAYPAFYPSSTCAPLARCASAMVFRLVIRATKPGCPRPSLQWRWGPAVWSGTSRWTVPCGGRTTPRRSSRMELRAS